MQCTTSKAGERTKGGEHTTRGPEPTDGRSWILESRHTSGPVDTIKATTKGAHDTTHQSHISKICLDFDTSCLRKSRGNTKAHQKFIHFWPVLTWFDALLECRRLWKQGRMNAGLLYRGHAKRDTPPIGGATSALHPHNFSHHKNRKKFAYLWLEKFSEIFYGRMFRVKESPQSCGKGARC